MSFKKRGSSKWTDTPNYIMGTSTDTITTLPADIYPTGTTAMVGLKGNMEQNGTPTPDNPVMPQETGDLETTGEKAGQYKIPISSAGQTTPVYLGEVETTRQIKKLVLTGKENWAYEATYTRFKLILPDMIFLGIRTTPILCSHYITIDDGRALSNIPNNAIYVGGTVKATQILIKTDEYNTESGFKGYLAQQYAAGTPVTVWYILAEPETAIVNGPLRKISDYADTVSGITIPTITGANTIDVDTTPKPSEVSVNYKGWHSIQSLHRFNGTSWD